MSELKPNWWTDWRWWAGSVFTGFVIYVLDRLLP